MSARTSLSPISGGVEKGSCFLEWKGIKAVGKAANCEGAIAAITGNLKIKSPVVTESK
jgi:hypothetical protein